MAFCGVSQNSNAGLLELLFPSMRPMEHEPTASGHAPFAAPELQADGSVKEDPDHEKSLDSVRLDFAKERMSELYGYDAVDEMLRLLQDGE